MPTKDLYHNTVRNALEKGGWTVTDNLSLKVGKRDLFIDLGAEKLLIAQRANQKIAVEVKSFISASPVSDLEQALGQYLLYEDLMQTQYLDRLAAALSRRSAKAIASFIWLSATLYTRAFFRRKLFKSFSPAVV